MPSEEKKHLSGFVFISLFHKIYSQIVFGNYLVKLFDHQSPLKFKMYKQKIQLVPRCKFLLNVRAVNECSKGYLKIFLTVLRKNYFLMFSAFHIIQLFHLACCIQNRACEMSHTCSSYKPTSHPWAWLRVLCTGTCCMALVESCRATWCNCSMVA